MRVKPGDTLSAIAMKHNISITTLMELNKITNSDSLIAGTNLRLPSQTNNEIHKVKKGETISSIANFYGLNKHDLISMNRLESADYLHIDQILELPKQVSRKDRSTFLENYNYNANTHLVAKGQTLVQISKAYKIPLHTLISINSLSNPNNLKEGEKLSLRATNNSSLSISQKQKKQNQWRKYGPLKINWSNWRIMGGSYVAPTLNGKGKALYLAVNCPARKINATGTNGTWKEWNLPVNKFEHQLINDLCKDKKV